MESKFKTLTLKDRKSLIEQLIHAGYAFAAWSMPQSTSVHLIISLSEATKTDKQLSELDSGFLVNEYSSNHPIYPYFIPADILLHDDQQLKLDPKTKASELDQLMDAIASSESKRKTSSSSSSKDVYSDTFIEAVKEAIQEIQNEEFEKVVLSRTKDVPLPEDFNAWEFFSTINEKYVNAFCSLSFIPGKGVWIGATPELLIANNKERFKTVSLAGTKRLEVNQELSEIAWTQKEIEEQAFVSRYVINCFKKIRLREFHEHGPKTIKAGTLAHLKTEFEVKFDEVSYDGLAEQMLELLHPTSAVCGMPIEKVKPWIASKEKYDREFYSGFLGPVNIEESTDLFVNLRCVKIDDGLIRFYAGAGITEDSNPAKEMEETELKMNVLKSLI